MKTNPISINQGLQGRIAGVQVNQNDGAPGAGVSIQIRGANSFSTSTEPLISWMVFLLPVVECREQAKTV